MSFGENLKRIRKDRGLTQAELAKKLDTTQQTIGRYETGNLMTCDRTTIVKYERGEGISAINKICAIATALDCTVGELFGDEPKVIYEPPEGKWQVLQLGVLGDAWTVQCSHCKAIGFHGMTPYCSECGAKMTNIELEGSKTNE